MKHNTTYFLNVAYKNTKGYQYDTDLNKGVIDSSQLSKFIIKCLCHNEIWTRAIYITWYIDYLYLYCYSVWQMQQIFNLVLRFQFLLNELISYAVLILTKKYSYYETDELIYFRVALNFHFNTTRRATHRLDWAQQKIDHISPYTTLV